MEGCEVEEVWTGICQEVCGLEEAAVTMYRLGSNSSQPVATINSYPLKSCLYM